MNVFTLGSPFKQRRHRLQAKSRQVFACSDFRQISTSENTLFCHPFIATYPSLWSVNCTQDIPVPSEPPIIFSSHWSLCLKRPPRLAMHPCRRFVKAWMALATRCWEIWAQQSLRRSFRLSIAWIFTPASLALPRRRMMWFNSGLLGGQASGLRYRRQAWSR